MRSTLVSASQDLTRLNRVKKTVVFFELSILHDLDVTLDQSLDIGLRQ
jgi:hypothetical protein